VELADKMVRYGIARSRSHAFNIMIEKGLSEVLKEVENWEPLSLAIYSVKSVRAEIVEIDFNKVLRDAFSRAPILKLRTLDLLHITACRAAGCEEFATLDSDIVNKSEAISKELGVKVITVN